MRRGPALSARTAWEMGESAYASAVREARATGAGLIDLTGSNPTSCGLELHSAETLNALGDPRGVIYEPDARGSIAAREAVARYHEEHGAPVDPERLVLTASTSESYSFLFRLLCDPGDEVLIALPSYPLFDLLAALDNVRLRPYPLLYDEGWWIDFTELERRVGARTRAIIVVHPNNPTGHWTRRAERARLEEMCAERGLALIVDEVFLDYPLSATPTAARSFACGPHPALTFVLSGMSKIAALPQMKVAWIAMFGPNAIASDALARLEVIADTFLSVSTPVQLALPVWLDGRREVQGKLLERVRTSLRVLDEFARGHPEKLRVFAPEAGWTAVLSLPCCGGDPGCAEALVRERGVVLHPGSFYGMGERNRVVASLLTPPNLMADALQRF